MWQERKELKAGVELLDTRTLGSANRGKEKVMGECSGEYRLAVRCQRRGAALTGLIGSGGSRVALNRKLID